MAPPPILRFSFIFLVACCASAAGGETFTTYLQEHNAMVETIRNNGFILFANAIETSDLRFDLLKPTNDGEEGSSSLFTIFAPRNELIFAVDTAYNATEYVNILRYHVIPNRRHSYADLQNLTSRSLETLVPEYAVLIEDSSDVNSFRDSSDGVTVDGIRISNPNLFLGQRLAVHGIDGILLKETSLMRGLDFPDDNEPRFLTPSESPSPAAGPIGSHAPGSQFPANDDALAIPPTKATGLQAEHLVNQGSEKSSRDPGFLRWMNRRHHRQSRPGDL